MNEPTSRPRVARGASRTALGTAALRWLHQSIDGEPKILTDPVSGLRLGEGVLLRRYLSLTEAGYRWLLVKVDDNELAAAAAAAQVARACGATLAVYYRTLTVEELIP